MVLSLLARQELFLSVLFLHFQNTVITPLSTDCNSTVQYSEIFFSAVHPLSLFKTMASYEFIIQGCVNTRREFLKVMLKNMKLKRVCESVSTAKEAE